MVTEPPVIKFFSYCPMTGFKQTQKCLLFGSFLNMIICFFVHASHNDKFEEDDDEILCLEPYSATNGCQVIKQFRHTYK